MQSGLELQDSTLAFTMQVLASIHEKDPETNPYHLTFPLESQIKFAHIAVRDAWKENMGRLQVGFKPLGAGVSSSCWLASTNKVYSLTDSGDLWKEFCSENDNLYGVPKLEEISGWHWGMTKVYKSPLYSSSYKGDPNGVLLKWFMDEVFEFAGSIEDIENNYNDIDWDQVEKDSKPMLQNACEVLIKFFDAYPTAIENFSVDCKWENIAYNEHGELILLDIIYANKDEF